jgi:hypothetical protein
LRVLGDQPLDERRDRVPARGAAEQHLEAPVVEGERGAQRRFLLGVEAAHGPDDGHGGAVLEAGWRHRGHATPPGGDERGGEMGEKGKGSERGSGKGKRVHAISAG